MEKMQQTGFFWHVHHEILLEWCHSYDERVEYIRTEKPKAEIKLRLRLFKPVWGSLPEEVVKAWQAYVEAWQAYNKTRQAYNKARQAYDEAWRALDKAERVYDKAWQVYNKAGQAYTEAVSRNRKAIEALHEKECPNCPWNGETIFPK